MSGKRRAGTSTPRERGAFGNKRGKEAQARRRRLREADPRVRRAHEEVDAHLRRLEALERELAELSPVPSVMAQLGTVSVSVARPSEMAGGNGRWTMGQARSLVLDGYRADHVTAYTGWGSYWLRDLVGADGYMRPLDGW